MRNLSDKYKLRIRYTSDYYNYYGVITTGVLPLRVSYVCGKMLDDTHVYAMPIFLVGIIIGLIIGVIAGTATPQGYLGGMIIIGAIVLITMLLIFGGKMGFATLVIVVLLLSVFYFGFYWGGMLIVVTVVLIITLLYTSMRAATISAQAARQAVRQNVTRIG